MTESYEKKMTNDATKENPNYLDYSVMRYLWLANPLSRTKKDSIPKFLRNLELFKSLSDNELRILSKSFHQRKFIAGEVIFRQGDVGVGFYLIYNGRVELKYNENTFSGENQNIVVLEEFDYFGEIALIQDNSLRTVTAIAKEDCELLGFFKPDLDRLINNKPVVAAKFLRAIASSFADKLIFLTNEASKQKKKLLKVETKLKEKSEELLKLEAANAAEG